MKRNLNNLHFKPHQFLIKHSRKIISNAGQLMGCLVFLTSQVLAGINDSTWSSHDTLFATVKAYESNRPVSKIPVSISFINESQFLRFANNSLVSPMNMNPGVRLEERSPGSYRLNMRGSSLRSPFGIRNIKVYFNDIPFTDPGGNTYLNQLDSRNMQSMEIIKGPASSLYGAGSGGALIIHTMPASSNNKVSGEFSGGSYGLMLASAAVNIGSDNQRNKIQYTHQQSDGWRQHTNMRRDIATIENRISISNKQTLQTIFLYGDLYYQTPGGLTLNEYLKDPRAARPQSGFFPSAETARAAVYQQTFLAGLTDEYRLSKKWKNTTAIYGASTWFKNPTFRLYEKRTEPHFGGRTFFTQDFSPGRSLIHLVYGMEAQKGIFTSSTYKNKGGNPDTILTNDEINNWRYSVFTQGEWLFGKGWNITAGFSYNKSHAGIQRLLVYPVTTQKRTFSSEIAPRIALMKSFRTLNFYASVSKGFSPPTTSELLPGTGVINTTLQPEEGINYEMGVKTSLSNISVEIALYHYNLTNAISLRRDAGGGDYYINAGETKQNGIEFSSTWLLLNNRRSFFKNVKIFTTYTGNFYEYKNYKVIDKDFSGHLLPGIPKNNLITGLDLIFSKGFYGSITYQWVDKIPLNDANNVFAGTYQLLSCRIGYLFSIGKKTTFEVFGAADNLLNQVYSLGNDINAAGGRYYNAAPGRNVLAGVIIKY